MTTKQSTEIKHYARLNEINAVDLRVTDLIHNDRDEIAMVERVDRKDRYVPGDCKSDVIYVYWRNESGRGSFPVGRYSHVKRFVKIEVGMPATIHLYSDSVAAVVVKINAKSIVVRRVERDEDSKRRVNDEREPWPCFAWDGILDQPIGNPERYGVLDNGRITNGSISVTVGRSISRTDYRV